MNLEPKQVIKACETEYLSASVSLYHAPKLKKLRTDISVKKDILIGLVALQQRFRSSQTRPLERL
jgi:hypothetical protein